MDGRHGRQRHIHLSGTLGTVSKTVNTRLIKRMESDRWNYVTIPSDDLGPLTSVSVQRDGEGDAPDWHLDRIIVASTRYGTHARPSSTAGSTPHRPTPSTYKGLSERSGRAVKSTVKREVPGLLRADLLTAAKPAAGAA
jgi:hypothetical protein